MRPRTPPADCCRLLAARLRAVHADERGTISILTVFAMLLFTMLLMLLFNIAKQHDDKVRMQNAADAAAYSGGVVLARSMNAIAFANHLEADVFAVTAFLREARDRNAERYVPEVLAAWVEAGGKFANSPFPKFQGLNQAIAAKAPLEQEFVAAWSEMAAAASAAMLPVFESILGTPEPIAPGARDHLIPEFQRAVIELGPGLSQDTTHEIALRHGLRQEDLDRLNTQMLRQPGFHAGERGPQAGVLWRTSVLPVGSGGEYDPLARTLPVVDPEPYQPDYAAVPDGASYLQEARLRREMLAKEYLRQWVADRDLAKGLDWLDEEASMSQFARLFWSAACGQLEKLLNEEYPNTNVPIILRDFTKFQQAGNDHDVNDDVDLERHYSFVGVVYRRHVDETAPLVFRNPLDQTADAQTFAQVTLFIPRARHHCCPWGWYHTWIDADGVPQQQWIDHMDNWSPEWSTFNQNWTVKLVPATTPALAEILAANPGGAAQGFRTPGLTRALHREVQAVNTH